MKLDLTRFDEFLYAERKKQDLNQNQLAKRSGVDHTMISRYENFMDCKVSTMVKLLEGLGYSPVIEIRRKEHDNGGFGKQVFCIDETGISQKR